MGVGEDGQEVDALLANGRLGGRIGIMNAVDERGEGVVIEGLSDGLELSCGERESGTVGELVEAGDDSVLEIVSG